MAVAARLGDIEERSAKGCRWRRVRMLNAWVDDLAIGDILEIADEGVVFTINPDHLYHLQRNAEFAEAYAQATHVSCDSLYIFQALKLLGRAIEHRASGSDIVPAYWQKHAANPHVRIFLLGAKPGVAQRACERINRLAGREIVVGAHGPSFEFV